MEKHKHELPEQRHFKDGLCKKRPYSGSSGSSGSRSRGPTATSSTSATATANSNFCKKKNRLNPKSLSIPNVKNQLKPSIRTPQQNIQNKEIDIENFLGTYQNQPKTKVQRVKEAIGTVAKAVKDTSKNVLLTTTGVKKMREEANEVKLAQKEREVSDQYINEEICMMTNQTECNKTDGCKLDKKLQICFPSMGVKMQSRDKYIEDYLTKNPTCKSQLRASAKTDNDLFNICSGAFKTKNSYKRFSKCDDENALDLACMKNLQKVKGRKEGEEGQRFNELIRNLSFKQGARKKEKLNKSDSKIKENCETALKRTGKIAAICEKGRETGNYFSHEDRKEYRPYCMLNERVEQLCNERKEKEQMEQREQECVITDKKDCTKEKGCNYDQDKEVCFPNPKVFPNFNNEEHYIEMYKMNDDVDIDDDE